MSMVSNSGQTTEGDVVSPEDAVLHWLYLKESRLERDPRASDVWAGHCSGIHIFGCYKYHFLAVSIITLMLLLWAHELKVMLRKRRKKYKQKSLSAQRSDKKSLHRDAEARKNVESAKDVEGRKDDESAKDVEGRKDDESAKDAEGRKDDESAKDAEGRKDDESAKDAEGHKDVPHKAEKRSVTEHKNTGPSRKRSFYLFGGLSYIITAVVSLISTFYGLFRGNKYVTSPNKTTTITPLDSSLKLSTISPQDKISSSLSNACNILNKPTSTSLIKKSISNKATKAHNARDLLGTKTKYRVGVTSFKKKYSTSAENYTETLSKIDETGSTENTETSFFTNHKNTVFANKTLPKVSISSRSTSVVRRSDVDLEFTIEGEADMKHEGFEERDVDISEIPTLAIDKFREINCLRAEECERSLPFCNDWSYTGRSDRLKIKQLYPRPKADVAQRGTWSKIHQFSLKAPVDSTIGKNKDGSRLLDMLLAKDLKYTRKGSDTPKISTRKKQHQPINRYESALNYQYSPDCMCHNYQKSFPRNRSLMTVEEAAGDLMSGNFGSICRKYSAKMIGNTPAIPDSISSKLYRRGRNDLMPINKQRDLELTTSKLKEIIDFEINMQDTKIQSNYSYTKSLSSDQAENEWPDSFPKTVSTASDLWSDCAQISPQPSRKLVLGHSKVHTALSHLGQPSHQIQQHKQFMPKVACVLFDHNGCLQIMRKKLPPQTRHTENGYKYVLNQDVQSYHTSDQRFLPRSINSTKVMRKAMRNWKAAAHKKRKDLLINKNYLDMEIDHDSVSAQFITYIAHSSTNLSPANESDYGKEHVPSNVSSKVIKGQRLKSQEVIPKVKHRSVKMSQKESCNGKCVHPVLDLFDRTRFSSQKEAKQTAAHSATSKRKSSYNEELSHGAHDPAPNVNGDLFKRDKHFDELVGISAPRLPKAESMKNVKTWLSKTRNCDIPCLPSAGIEMKREENIAGRKEYITPSTDGQGISVPKENPQYVHQRHDNVIRSVECPQKHNAPSSPLSSHPARKSLIADRLKHTSQDPIKMTAHFDSNISPGREKVKHVVKKMKPIHADKDRTRNREERYKNSRSQKAGGKFHTNTSRKSPFFNYRNTDTLATNFVNTVKPSNIPKIQKILMNTSTQQRQSHSKSIRRQPTTIMTAPRDSKMCVSVPSPVLNVQQNRIDAPMSESPSYIHMPLFKNKHNEAVNIIFRIDSLAQKNLLEKDKYESNVLEAISSGTHSQSSMLKSYRFLNMNKSKSKHLKLDLFSNSTGTDIHTSTQFQKVHNYVQDVPRGTEIQEFTNQDYHRCHVTSTTDVPKNTIYLHEMPVTKCNKEFYFDNNELDTDNYYKEIIHKNKTTNLQVSTRQLLAQLSSENNHNAEHKLIKIPQQNSKDKSASRSNRYRTPASTRKSTKHEKRTNMFLKDNPENLDRLCQSRSSSIVENNIKIRINDRLTKAALDFATLPTDNHSRTTMEDGTQMSTEDSSRISTWNNPRILTKNCLNLTNDNNTLISTDNLTRISEDDSLRIPTESYERKSTDDSKKPHSEKSATLSTENHLTSSGKRTGTSNEDPRGTPFQDEIRIPTELSLGYPALYQEYKIKREETHSLRDSRRGLQHSQTTKQDNTPQVTKCKEGLSRSQTRGDNKLVNKSKPIQNKVNVVYSNKSNKYLKSNHPKSDVMPNDKITEPGGKSYLTCQLYRHVNSENTLGGKCNEMFGKPNHKWTMSHVENRSSINLKHLSRSSQARLGHFAKSIIRKEKNGSEVGAEDTPEACTDRTEGRILRKHNFSENVSTAHFKRRWINKETEGNKLDKYIGIHNTGSQDRDAAQTNCSLEKLLEPAKVSVPVEFQCQSTDEKGERALHNLDDILSSNSIYSKTSRQNSQPKLKSLRTTKEIRIPNNSSITTNSQEADSVSPWTISSRSPTEREGSEEDVSQSTQIKHSPRGPQAAEVKVDQLPQKQQKEMKVFSFNTKLATTKQTSQCSTSQDAPAHSNKSTLLASASFQKKNICKRSKVDEISRSTGTGQETRKLTNASKNISIGNNTIASLVRRLGQLHQKSCPNDKKVSACRNCSPTVDSALVDTGIATTPTACDKLRATGRLQDILLKKTHQSGSCVKKSDSGIVATYKKSENNGTVRVKTQKTCQEIIHEGVAKLKSLRKKNKIKMTSDNTSDINVSLKLHARGSTKGTLNRSIIQAGKYQKGGVPGFQVSEESTSKQTVVKKRCKTEIEHHKNVEHHAEFDFADSIFDENEDYRLPDRLPDKIGGSTDISISPVTICFPSTKYGFHGNSSIVEYQTTMPNDMKSATHLNVDELREKYLREMTMRGLCRKERTCSQHGMFEDNDNYLWTPGSTANNMRQPTGSNTITIKSASSASLEPRIVASSNTLTIHNSSASKSTKTSLKRKRDEDEELLSSFTNTVSKGNNNISRTGYSNKGATSNFLEAISKSNREKQKVGILENHDAVPSTENVRPIKRHTREIHKNDSHQANLEISFNQPCTPGPYLASSFASPNNEPKTDVRKYTFTAPEKTTILGLGRKFWKNRGVHEVKVIDNSTPCSTPVSIPAMEHSELTSQALRSPKVNSINNYSYTLASAQMQDSHPIQEEEPKHKNGSKKSAHHNRTLYYGKTHITKSSRIPITKKTELNSGRRQRSDTRSFSPSRILLREKLRKELAKKSKSSSFSKLDTVCFKKQSMNKIEAMHRHATDPKITMSPKNQQPKIADTKSSGSSTDVVVSWFDRSNMQETLQPESDKEICSNLPGNCQLGSISSTLNYSLATVCGFQGDAMCLSNNPDELQSKQDTDQPKESGELDTSAKKRKQETAENKSLFQTNPKLTPGRIKKQWPHWTSVSHKLQNETPNDKFTHSKGGESQLQFWQSKLETNPHKIDCAADLIGKNNSDLGKNTSRSKELGLKCGFGDANTPEKCFTKSAGVVNELETENQNQQKGEFKTSGSTQNGDEQKVMAGTSLARPEKVRTLRCFAKNRKYVNSALMYNIKKRGTISPYKPQCGTKERPLVTKDPALGTNNSAKMNNPELHSKIPLCPKIHLYNFKVGVGGSKCSYDPEGHLSQTANGQSAMCPKQDENAVDFFSTNEHCREKPRRQMAESGKSNGLSENGCMRERHSLSKENCVDPGCGFKQRMAAISSCAQSKDSDKIDHARKVLDDNDSRHGQCVKEEAEVDGENEGANMDNDNKMGVPEDYHTNGSMFVASNSCKVNFDWYKPSATVPTSNNCQGETHGHSSRTGNQQPTAIFLGDVNVDNHQPTGFQSDCQERSAISNNYTVYSAQDHRSIAEQSQFMWLPRTHQEASTHDSAQCHVPNFVANTKEHSTEQTQEYGYPLTTLPEAEPCSDISFATLFSWSQNPAQYTMPTQFSNPAQYAMPGRFSDHIQTAESCLAPDTVPHIQANGHHPVPHTTRIVSIHHTEGQANHFVRMPNEDVSVSNLNTLYQNLQQNYNKANAFFHSNWVHANQNSSLNSLTPIPGQSDNFTNNTNNVFWSQHKPQL